MDLPSRADRQLGARRLIFASALLLPIALLAGFIAWGFIHRGNPYSDRPLEVFLKLAPPVAVACAGVCGLLVGSAAARPSEKIARTIAVTLTVLILYGAVLYAVSHLPAPPTQPPPWLNSAR